MVQHAVAGTGSPGIDVVSPGAITSTRGSGLITAPKLPGSSKAALLTTLFEPGSNDEAASGSSGWAASLSLGKQATAVEAARGAGISTNTRLRVGSTQSVSHSAELPVGRDASVRLSVSAVSKLSVWSIRSRSRSASMARPPVSGAQDIGNRMDDIFKCSMSLASLPCSPCPALDSSSDGEPAGSDSDDDVAGEEEEDLLQRMLMVMPNLQSPGESLVRPELAEATGSAGPTPRSPNDPPTPRAGTRTGQAQASRFGPSASGARIEPSVRPGSAFVQPGDRPRPGPPGKVKVKPQVQVSSRSAAVLEYRDRQLGAIPLTPGSALDTDARLVQMLAGSMVGLAGRPGSAPAGKPGSGKPAAKGPAKSAGKDKGKGGKGGKKEKAPAVYVPPPLVPLHLQHFLPKAVGPNETGGLLFSAPTTPSGTGLGMGRLVPGQGVMPGSPGLPTSPGVGVARPLSALGGASVSVTSMSGPGPGMRPHSAITLERNMRYRAATSANPMGHGSVDSFTSRPASAGPQAQYTVFAGHADFGRSDSFIDGPAPSFSMRSARPDSSSNMSPWARAQLHRAKDLEDTKASALASMSPLRATLSRPVSGLRQLGLTSKRMTEADPIQVTPMSLEQVATPVAAPEHGATNPGSPGAVQETGRGARGAGTVAFGAAANIMGNGVSAGARWAQRTPGVQLPSSAAATGAGSGPGRPGVGVTNGQGSSSGPGAAPTAGSPPRVPSPMGQRPSTSLGVRSAGQRASGGLTSAGGDAIAPIDDSTAAPASSGHRPKSASAVDPRTGLSPMMSAAAKLGTYGNASRFPPQGQLFALAGAMAPPTTLTYDTPSSARRRAAAKADKADPGEWEWPPSPPRSPGKQRARRDAGEQEGGHLDSGAAECQGQQQQQDGSQDGSALMEALEVRVGVSSSGTPQLHAARAAAVAAAGMALARDEAARVMLMQEVHHSGNTGPTDRVGEVGRLVRRFNRQQDPSVFNLNHSLAGVDQVIALVDVLPQLSSISSLLLAGNDLDDDAFARLMVVLSSSACVGLTGLDLGHNPLTAMSIERMLVLLRDDLMFAKRKKNASTLDLTPKHAVLTRLNLSGCSIGDAGAELLFDCVGNEICRLEILEVSRCGIGERSAHSLGRMLEDSRFLRRLDASWNTLGRRGGQAIGDGLAGADTVSHLLLAWTGLTDAGARHVAAALKSNSVLQVLDLSGNAVSRDTCTALMAALAHKAAGTASAAAGGNALGAAAADGYGTAADGVKPVMPLQLILRDNPLGVYTAQRLLQALAEGGVAQVDLTGCSFSPLTDPTTRTRFDPLQPDGHYTLDLSVPAQRTVALALLDLAAVPSQGLRTWRNVQLAGRPFTLRGTSRMQIPEQGVLELDYVSSYPIPLDTLPLTMLQLRTLWLDAMDPDGKVLPALPSATTGKAGSQTTSPVKGNGKVLPTKAKPAAAGKGKAAAPLPPPPLPPSPAPDEHVWPFSLNPVRVAEAPLAEAQAADAGKGKGKAIQPAASAKAPGKKGGKGDAQPPPPPPPPPPSFRELARQALLDSVQRKCRTLLESAVCKQGPVGDVWRLALLNAIISGSHLTCSQLCLMLTCMDTEEARVEAAVHAFGALVDPHNLRQALVGAGPGVTSLVFERLGPLATFTPDNPTGQYTLDLSQPHHACIARQLLVAYMQQLTARICQAPKHLCFHSVTMDGADLDVTDPCKIALPSEGHLSLSFVDLRPMPPATLLTAQGLTMSHSQFAVLLAFLTDSPDLDPQEVQYALSQRGLNKMVGTVRVWSAWMRSHPRALSSYVPTAGGLMPSVLQSLTTTTIDEKRSQRVDGGGNAAAAPVRPGVKGTGSGAAAGRASPRKSGTGGPHAADAQATAHANLALLLPQTSSAGLISSGPVPKKLSSSGALQQSPRAATAPPPPLMSRPPAQLYPPPPPAPPPPSLLTWQIPPEDSHVVDLGNFVPTMKTVLAHRFISCSQLMQLLALLPAVAGTQRVELCRTAWARAYDRAMHWPSVLRCLTSQQQVLVCQALGYANVFNPRHPCMHYRLRMSRPDEQAVAWQLYTLSLACDFDCWGGLTIDGKAMRRNNPGPNQGVQQNVWALFLAGDDDGSLGHTTLEFTFAYEERPQSLQVFAATTLQRWWRSMRAARAPPPAAPNKKKGKKAADDKSSPKN